VNLLCSWANISSDGIEVGCDGLLSPKSFDIWPLEPTDPHFDMLTSIRTMITNIPLIHQDNYATAKLDFWTKQNILMNITWQSFLGERVPFSTHAPPDIE
jgi:hypothetical protein